MGWNNDRNWVWVRDLRHHTRGEMQTELSLSAWRDRRSTDILHKSFQKCSRGFDRKPRPGVELTHISIWHSEAVRRRWLGIAVHVLVSVSSISKVVHSPQTVSPLPHLVYSLDPMDVRRAMCLTIGGVRAVPERPCLTLLVPSSET